VRVAVDGAEVATGWSVDPFSGVVTFAAAPATGAVISAGFTFDIPVRFRDATLSTQMMYFDAEGTGIGSVPDIPLIEVRV
ncbi:MAG: DUF2460 domain-containing protein, partial [Pseudomonadota bacterium]